MRLIYEGYVVIDKDGNIENGFSIGKSLAIERFLDSHSIKLTWKQWRTLGYRCVKAIQTTTTV